MFILTIQSDHFQVDVEHTEFSLHIDRSSGVMMRTTTPGRSTRSDLMNENGGFTALHGESDAVQKRIFGIIGIANLLCGRYLIVATDAKSVASIAGADIRLLTAVKFFPFLRSDQPSRLTSQQQRDEQRYLSLMERALTRCNLHFSYDYDLTLRTQRIAELGTIDTSEASKLPAGHWRRQDDRFFWNLYLSQALIAAQMDEWVVPLMSGYVFSQTLSINENMVDFVLISRRSWKRTGLRFITRGADLQGNVANFAETEQVLYVHEKEHGTGIQVAAFLQTRGSIPLLWQQPPTMKYAPKIQLIKEGPETELSFRRHFEFQVRQYGRNIAINLINQKGSEGQLVRAYTNQERKAIKQNVPLRLINWDFHHECRKMKYENIEKLVRMVEDDLKQIGYFKATLMYEGSSGYPWNRGHHIIWQVHMRQEGVLRTNCIDCLDRTNVVQSVFARNVLEKQLNHLGILVNNMQKSSQLDAMLRIMWANNADVMSVQYSGTGALKTDYTRTGKRSIQGALKDGINSLTRYYLNNFVDGVNQDALDLLLGLYRPSLSLPSPFDNNLPDNVPNIQYSASGFFLRLSLAMMALLLAWNSFGPSPWKSWGPAGQLLVFVTLYGVVAHRMILRYGKRFTNKPRLLAHYFNDAASVKPTTVNLPGNKPITA